MTKDLTIIYYFDKSRPIQFRISPRRLRILLLGCLSASLWLPASILLLYRKNLDLTHPPSITESVETPRVLTSVAQADPSSRSQGVGSDVKVPTATLSKASSTEEVLAYWAAHKGQIPQNDKVKCAKLEGMNGSAALTIGSAMICPLTSHLTMFSVQLRNLSTELQDGYLSVRATYQAPDGSKIITERMLDPNAKSLPRDTAGVSALHYRFARSVRKDFAMKKPMVETVQLRALDVALKSKTGASAEQFHLEIPH